jgi:Bacteriophage T4-like portal protein (Gp20)
MPPLAGLRQLVFGDDLDDQQMIDKLLDKVRTQLVDYSDAKYESILGALHDVVTKSNDPKAESIYKNLLSELSGTYIEKDRLDRYRTYQTIKDRIPEVSQALSVYVDNILAPDDYLKKSLQVVLPKEHEEEAVKNKLMALMNDYKFEEQVGQWIRKTLLWGDFFVEIRSYTPELRNQQSTLTESKGGIVKPFKKLVPLDVTITLKNFKEANGKNGKDKKEVEPIYETTLKVGMLDNKGYQILKEQTSKVHYLQEAKRFVVSEGEPTTGKGRRVIEILTWAPEFVACLEYQNINLGYVLVRTPKSITLSALQPTMGSTSTKVVQNFVAAIVKSAPALEDVFKNNPTVLHNLAKIVSAFEEDIAMGQSISISYIPPQNMEHFKLPSDQFAPYGESIIQAVANVGRYLITIEYAMIIYRLTRAPERRIFKIEVGRQRDVTNYIQQVIRKTKQKEVFLKESGSIDALLSELSMFEDYYIPVVDGKEILTIETTPPGELTAKTEDIEYMRKKLISGLGVPAIYLVADDNAESKYTLAQENVKFARTVVSLQKILGVHVTSLLHKLWNLKYNTTEGTTSRVVFKPPMALQMERMNEVLTSVQGVVGLLTDLLGVSKVDIAKQLLSPLVDIDELVESERLKKSLHAGEPEGGGEPGGLFGGAAPEAGAAPPAETGAPAGGKAPETPKPTGGKGAAGGAAPSGGGLF